MAQVLLFQEEIFLSLIQEDSTVKVNDLLAVRDPSVTVTVTVEDPTAEGLRLKEQFGKVPDFVIEARASTFVSEEVKLMEVSQLRDESISLGVMEKETAFPAVVV